MDDTTKHKSERNDMQKDRRTLHSTNEKKISYDKRRQHNVIKGRRISHYTREKELKLESIKCLYIYKKRTQHYTLHYTRERWALYYLPQDEHITLYKRRTLHFSRGGRNITHKGEDITLHKRRTNITQEEYIPKQKKRTLH